MPDSKVKHDWYQTESHVVIEVRIKGLQPDTVKAEFGATTLRQEFLKNDKCLKA
jgi:hypothetical protein